jgi:rfaE bifunctional protein nucleotidyltransferase chain/domain
VFFKIRKYKAAGILLDKIKSIDDLAIILKKARRSGKKIVHCHGVFDLLHPGHVKHFQAAKRKGDILIVTLTKDEYVNKGPGRPVFNHNLRAETIAAFGCVDFVAINDGPTAVEAIKKLRPHFYVKGSDYAQKQEDITGKIFEEEEAVRAVGGMLHFTDEISFSSSSLINAHFSPLPEEAKNYLLQFKKKFSASSVLHALDKTDKLKVLVIGDVIIDEYHYCVGMGKTSKDNIIATRFMNEEVFAGGVLAACNHIAGLCSNTTLLSVIGTANDYRQFIASHLKPKIKTNFYYSKAAPTVVKRRFIEPSFLTKLFEICYLDEKNLLSPELEKEICGYLGRHLKDFNMVLVTDFGHGLLTPEIIRTICEKANFLAVNVQTNSSNIGFNVITKFPRADFICIDEPEIRLATQDKASNLENLVLAVCKKLRCKNVIITRGHRGALAYSKKDGFSEIPVLSKEVLDRVGAGDAFFSFAAPCVCLGQPMELVGLIGNAVGAMKVLIVGNRAPVDPIALRKYIAALLK